MRQLLKFALFLPLMLSACSRSVEKGAENPVIGVVLPLSGSSAQYGKYVRDGFELGMADVAAGGPAAPARVYEDDAGVPQRAASATQRLAANSAVRIIFGGWNSSSVLAQAEVINQRIARGEDGVVVLGEAQSPQITQAGDFIFRIQPDSRYYLRTLVPYAMDRLRHRRFAILFLNNDYGRDQKDVFTALVRERGGEVVAVQGFDVGATNFRTALGQIAASSPDAIFIPVYAEAGPILKQAREQGIRAQFLGSAPMESPDVLTVAGSAAEGVVYAHHFDPESRDERVRRFIAAFQRRYGYAPEGYAALAYDAAFVVTQALRSSENRMQVRDFLYRYSGTGVTGPTRFDNNGDVVKTIVIRTVANGRFTTVR